MTGPSFNIDCTEQLGQLEPYISESGGIVVVTGGGASAVNRFIEAARKRVDGHAIKLNPSDENTRARRDIIEKLESKLGVNPDERSPSRPGVYQEVGKNVTAGGDVTMTVTIENLSPEPHAAGSDYQRCRRIVAAIRDAQGGGRRTCLILFNWHRTSAATVQWFWDDLLGDELDLLLGQGLLILCAYETEDPGLDHKKLMPDPQCVIRMPSAYRGGDLKRAQQDIVDILVEVRGEHPATARIQADALLRAASFQPDMVYGGLAGLLQNPKI